jgi:hypothetical protein
MTKVRILISIIMYNSWRNFAFQTFHKHKYEEVLMQDPFCVVHMCTKSDNTPFLSMAAALYFAVPLSVSLFLTSFSLWRKSARPITAGLCWIHTASQLHKTPGVNPPLYSCKDDDEEGRRPTTSPNYCASIWRQSRWGAYLPTVRIQLIFRPTLG